MASPIPLLCHDNAGSGFLVAKQSNVWLVTCVHIISGLINTPCIESFFSTAQICIVGMPVVIPLFVNDQQRFSLVKNETDGNLIDVIAVRLMPSEISGLINYGIYDATSIRSVNVGQTVIANGYPGLAQKILSGAIVFEPTQLQYEVDDVVGVNVRLSKPSIAGLSGGPISTDMGLIGIMQGDVGTITQMENALVISFDVIAQLLFK